MPRLGTPCFGDMLAYDDIGSGDPIVLIHGLAASREIWQAAAPLLGNRRVIMVDVPGFGGSLPAGAGFDLDEVAHAIWDGLPQDLGPVTLVGHSMGGAVALKAASLAPERVERLVLCAPAGLLPVPFPEWVMGPAGLVWDAAVKVRRHLEPLAAWPLGRRVLLGTSTAPGDPLSEDAVRAIIRSTGDARRTGAALRAVAHADLRDELVALPMPVGLIWGIDDRVVPHRSLDAGVAARPGIEVSVIEGTGHLPMVEEPQAFADAMLALLERLAAPPGRSARHGGERVSRGPGASQV